MIIFHGNAEILSGKTRKKIVQKFRNKFGPPVSEVLDPLSELDYFWCELSSSNILKHLEQLNKSQALPCTLSGNIFYFKVHYKSSIVL